MRSFQSFLHPARAILTGALLSAASVPGVAAVTPSLDVESGELWITPTTASGCVALLGVSRGVSGPLNWTVPWQAALVDEDGDGEIRVTPGNPVVPRSIWAAVDVTSGALAVGSAGDAPPEEIPAPTHLLAAPESIVDQRRSLDVLVVRPQHGAWYGRIRDGANHDQGAGDDGTVSVRLSDLEALWLEPGVLSGILVQLTQGDVVIGIDPDRGTYWQAVLDPDDL